MYNKLDGMLNYTVGYMSIELKIQNMQKIKQAYITAKENGTLRTRSIMKYEMSNFDGRIDDGMENALLDGEIGVHSAWNFNGRVYYQDGKFVEEVMAYGTLDDTIEADTLEELMETVNSKYGYV